MFKYVNELSNEIEELEKTITELKVIIKSASKILWIILGGKGKI